MSLLNRLDMFQAILDEGNMTAAAEKLYVSQPYLSKLLKQTEDEVGTPLFERLPREMRITMAGERYYVYLKRLESLEMYMSADIEMIAQHLLT
ncbi:LysR family transcriptional regulator [Fundicoccus ignavus]|uniref:LysR family transcriptional regulator n=1 Tax=Fundicoccus ignavus TaxID=2664442 RepID=A0A844C9W1_9LACT|nr:LysR family transcriptional regulator [Fundicoccus ignavus]MRJ46211.1 LysR family transcriptional regulator [Fundicoccus ignavus]